MNIYCCIIHFLKIANIYYLEAPVDQESKSSLAGWFWLVVSYEVSIKLSARAVVIWGSMTDRGALKLTPCLWADLISSMWTPKAAWVSLLSKQPKKERAQDGATECDHLHSEVIFHILSIPQTNPGRVWEGGCMKAWKPEGRDHWGPSRRLPVPVLT